MDSMAELNVIGTAGRLHITATAGWGDYNAFGWVTVVQGAA